MSNIDHYSFSSCKSLFTLRALGVPHQQKVFVKNPTASTVRFDAISGSTIHFHCSFPEHKVIFRTRSRIHFKLRGIGSGNPYRLRPLVGARVPLNGTFVSAVRLYNPHSTTLHVKEMYTSGGDVHLELPDTAPDKVHDSSLWEIAPYQTKVIMNAKVLAARERNATAYIKIKTALKKRRNVTGSEGMIRIMEEKSEDTLIVPVEVLIKRGLFSTSDILDFGLVRIGERSGQLMLEVVSTLEKGLEIESLYVAEKGTDDPSGIYMEFASKPPIAVKCGARQQPGLPFVVYEITAFSAKGKITAESRSGNYNISVPYVLNCVKKLSHFVTLKNTLPFGVTVWNVTVDDRVTLLPGESRPAFWLRYLKKQPDGFTAYVTLRTNVTTFHVPLSVHNVYFTLNTHSAAIISFVYPRITFQLYSTFKRNMHVLRISTLSRDPRMHFEVLDGDQTPILKSNQVSYLGRAQFRPNATCGENNCYLGINLNSGEGQWFTYGMKLPQNLAEIDTYLYKRLRKRWFAMRAQGRHIINETIIVDTNEHIPIPVTGELIWPRLLTRSVVHFPLTAVGNFTIMNLTLQNPASTSVVVQLLPLVIYPDADNLVEFFRDNLDSPLTEPIEMNETLMFSLRDTELFTLKSDSPVPMLREQLQEICRELRFTLSMLLRPGMKVRIRVGFLPNDYTLRSSLLLIRNNLTVIEPVVLYGKGSRVDMQVDGQSARSGKPLTFEILKHHLADCHNPKRLVHKLNTTLTVKRSFTVVNTGEVTFTVVNMSINYIPCENRGFRILNCHPFRLAPNETYILDIAYTPDFLMTWNEAALQFFMHMNSTSWMFLLGASIPFDMLAKCHSALPRPNVEWLIYYFSCNFSRGTLCLCFLASVCVWAWSYLEGERAVEEAIRQQYAQAPKVFDLNAVEANVKAKNDNPEIPRQQYTLTYSDDANFFSKLFWEAAQGVLWLFSKFWWFHRVKVSFLILLIVPLHAVFI
ncbi:unnamed protein product [Enterobius vermicularis]|uniref:TMEM131_like domain-containing protein n=1 Tax=Enterobius vermicularis TaxID=51028 RepID=A0A3P6HMZ7_ENTVE|nr:unnamed protein product [Enterobius vermicularis]